ncbi:malate synthase G [Thalassotalea fusca]
MNKSTTAQLPDDAIERIDVNGYQVTKKLHDFINKKVLPNTGLSNKEYWQAVTTVLDEFIPKNQELLAQRERLQSDIDAWHKANNDVTDIESYTQFLTDIGYIVPEGENFQVTTENVDEEIATIAGPQLVVPVMNARFALNAANARWGSLYDALYGSNVIADEDGCEAGKSYNPKRGAKVQAYAKSFLDKAIPLASGSHCDAVNYAIDMQQLRVTLKGGDVVGLASPEKLVGFVGVITEPKAILFANNGLHIDIRFDRESVVGQSDASGISDIVLESALSTIQDCEDSIAAVDVDDKLQVYTNWLGLMQGTLEETLEKNGQTITRKLHEDRTYHDLNGGEFTLPGRSLLFVRNVGHLMTNNAILSSDGSEVPEGILDALVTTAIALHDLKGNSPFKNSRKGSIYIVKPKMHGPEEVAFSDAMFARIEQLFGLADSTIKMGIMDEERRTSVNLKECIRAAKSRVAFINTGFLDRTGDEIHTSMLAGPMAPKDMMKNQPWIDAYETRNVEIGLALGLQGKAQIGKGMWAVPDQMAAMVEDKIAHPQSGANCAWVPSPTAATLHAMHYHKVHVFDVQNAILNKTLDPYSLEKLLTVPLLSDASSLTQDEIQRELDNNVQGLLGYVVRWVDQGVGCSKVPDIDNVGRMEDRATLRISSQHVCNWLHHGIVTKEQVDESLKRMAKIVDKQNQHDALYQPMADNFDKSIAFKAAQDLIFKGKEQPSGYTEPLLHLRRKELKAANT